MARPMTNMRLAYAFCITEIDPTTFEHHEALHTAKTAATIVQKGVKNVNMDNVFSILLPSEGCAFPSGEFMLKDVVECSLLRALDDPIDGTDDIKCLDVPIGRPNMGDVLVGKLRAYLTAEKLSTL